MKRQDIMLPTGDLSILSSIVKRGINPQDFFLVRDYQNQILVADDDRTKTVIIMLNMGGETNAYETDVPRLIHYYMKSGYNMKGIIYLTKGNMSCTVEEAKNFFYQGYRYLVDTYTIQFAYQ